MVVWTEYFKHRAQLRGFDLAALDQVVHFSKERYFDTATQRMVVVGRHGSRLVMIPYEEDGQTATPITVHTTSRQQITFRLRTGRFRL
ncbi:MAG: hypothetical protein L0387_04685 [Acidobacteria bacterium]|nr:hypothetical protein [Acidobacteriota bacterium]MCI0724952.1 hypothetical protein [Acidobacteriota bacterium]